MDEKVAAKPYKDKLDNLNRESLRTQLDLIDEDDIDVDDRIYIIQAMQCLEKADSFVEKNKQKDAISLYGSTIDLIKKIKSFNENNEQLTEILASAYYNKASCSHKLLSEKIYQDFQMRIQGENAVNDYSQFYPEEIIEDYLMSESYVTMDIDLKCQLYENVSCIYCEVIKDYDKAKEYALKSIRIKDDSGSAYSCLGNAYCELGEYMNAAKYYKKALEIIPEDISVQNNLYYVNLKLREKML
ncbi:MAG: tetratricopeptide repeat protein [Lachnospiraceae bacterium]|nr:tetratricopeptide repeat protein [Lachnospiraceae bacterium]